MQNLKLNYEARGINNYLTIQAMDEINKYQMKMLENNEIPGLLPVNSRILNGEYILDYNITGIKRLKDVLDSGRMQENDTKRIFAEMIQNMVRTEEYFLTFHNCFLNIEYIYINEKLEVKMVYLPFCNTEITTEEAIRVFCRELIANYCRHTKDPFFMDLLLYVDSQEFSMAGLLNQSEIGKQESAAVKVLLGGQKEYQMEENSNVPRISPEAENNKNDIEKKPVIAAGKPETSGGIAIPGKNMGAESTAQSKNNEEKTSLFKKLLRGGKKEEKKEEKENRKSKKKSKEMDYIPLYNTPGQTNEESEKRSNIKNSDEKDMPIWTGTMIQGIEQGNNTTIMIKNHMPYFTHRGQQIAIDHFPYMIGRKSPSADYVIERGVISDPHAKFSETNHNFYIQDQNSKNYTYVNGNKISPFTDTEIHDGDRLRLADEEIIFHSGTM